MDSDHEEEEEEALLKALHMYCGKICRVREGRPLDGISTRATKDSDSESSSSSTLLSSEINNTSRALSNTRNTHMNDDAIRKLTQMTFHYISKSLTADLSSFCQHANRKTITSDDCLLVARKNPMVGGKPLMEILQDRCGLQTTIKDGNVNGKTSSLYPRSKNKKKRTASDRSGNDGKKAKNKTLSNRQKQLSRREAFFKEIESSSSSSTFGINGGYDSSQNEESNNDDDDNNNNNNNNDLSSNSDCEERTPPQKKTGATTKLNANINVHAHDTINLLDDDSSSGHSDSSSINSVDNNDDKHIKVSKARSRKKNAIQNHSRIFLDSDEDNHEDTTNDELIDTPTPTT